MALFFLISLSVFSQNIQRSYTSSFAKLQDSLEKEMGRESMRTFQLKEISEHKNSISLQVIGDDEYREFVRKRDAFTKVRILYLNNINFENFKNYPFDAFPNLLAVKIGNCKNINFDNFISSLANNGSIKQLHFKDLDFDEWNLDINALKSLRVITIDNCKFQQITRISLNLDEFTVNNFDGGRMDTDMLLLDKVRIVKINNSLLKTFPYSLSNTVKLSHLDLSGSKIRKVVCGNILGFEDLLYLDLTESKINFDNVQFPGIDEKLYLIKNSDLEIIENSKINIHQ
ncbi:hypothetical protein LB467_16700 [Salegentibacter sp. JZCK2]|uniref:hypothetical protein n=1 Tax=Salegentibacter tibetensis TaxID=2873600 RepID=UPI001CCC6909|nr:hypothetical protein [Salegentibacter tibetensis]MBZ9731332.1 hypothetical protein [Salegentibacter tibetensis]